MPASIQALIFDFDGLLLDTETAAFESWRTIYSGYGQELTLDLWIEAVGRATGTGFDAANHLGTLTSEALDREDLLERRQRLKHSLCEKEPLLPGVREIIAEARELDLPCAVASSSGRAWVEGWLHRHELLTYFECVRTADDVIHSKPAPDLFLSAAACLGVQPRACVVFEDSPNGILAARAAGMRCIAVPGAITRQVPLPPAEMILQSLDEMPLRDLLRALEPGEGTTKDASSD